MRIPEETAYLGRLAGVGDSDCQCESELDLAYRAEKKSLYVVARMSQASSGRGLFFSEAGFRFEAGFVILS